MKFIKEIDLVNKEKAEISNKVSSIVYDVEKSKAIYQETISRIEEIDKKIASAEIARIELNVKVQELHNEIAILEINSGPIKERKVSYTSELKNLDNHISHLSSKNQKIEFYKSKINHRYEKIIVMNNKFEVDILKIKENLKININNKIETNSKLKNLRYKILLISQELQDNVTNMVKLKQKIENLPQLILGIEKKIT